MTDTSPIAIVTGASRGIGRAIALSLGAAGAKVAVNYAHDSNRAERALAEIRAAGGSAELFRADVTSESEVDAFVADLGYGQASAYLPLPGGKQRLVPLSPMQRRLLLCFCRRPRQVIAKETLMLEVWGRTQVSEVSLARTVHGLRRRLSESLHGSDLIRNVYGEGYIFTLSVEELGNDGGAEQIGRAHV